MFCKRNLATVVGESSDAFPALLVRGACRVGKSTFLESAISPARVWAARGCLEVDGPCGA